MIHRAISYPHPGEKILMRSIVRLQDLRPDRDNIIHLPEHLEACPRLVPIHYWALVGVELVLFAICSLNEHRVVILLLEPDSCVGGEVDVLSLGEVVGDKLEGELALVAVVVPGFHPCSDGEVAEDGGEEGDGE